ncbi:MAG TPA: hypothetical protein VNH18_10975 [Bryobacteraceae bacterium]|nr:hypothetical protein [Bryobacteraceae bacterium]
MQTTTVHAAEAALSQAPRIRLQRTGKMKRGVTRGVFGRGMAFSHEYSPEQGHEPIATVDKAMGIVDC